ncbi:hypothetical protein BC939DRAFT_440552, partial [Gamsiella multidivaricata]|uniref:uncharacterized protein n=1 Tax=Gamsiella multidivaricata TaxID=101098 RepID=UPI00221F5DDA
MFEEVAFGPSPPSLDPSQLVSILDNLIGKSAFVTSGTISQWAEACRNLESGVYNSSFVFVMSTLPLVEHALRLVYVAVNQCKEDRRSALIAGEYYLTLDVVLDRIVPAEYYDVESPVLKEYDASRIPNNLYLEFGDQVMNLLNDLFLLGYGPRLRDKASHGELNVYLNMDITKSPWFSYYSGLIIFLLNKYTPPSSASLSDEIAGCTSWINQYSTCRFDEWSALRKEAAHCQATLVQYDSYSSATFTMTNEHDSSTEFTPTIEVIFKFDDAAVFSNTASFSSEQTFQFQLRTSLAAWPAEKPDDPAVATFANNLPAWIIIIQSIHAAILRVTGKIMTLSEQLTQRQLSSRSRKQFEAMRPMVPRFLGMLVGCLALVEHLVLTPTSQPPPSSPAIGLDGPTGDYGVLQKSQIISASTEGEFSPLIPSTTAASTVSSINNGSAVDKSSVAEIQLRLKITTFVDKFVSNFDRVKLSMIEPAWEDLQKNAQGLETRGRSSRLDRFSQLMTI